MHVEIVHLLFMDFKKLMFQVGGRSCNILIAFGIPMKLLMLIKLSE
jgi:hypothetical protein